MEILIPNARIPDTSQYSKDPLYGPSVNGNVRLMESAQFMDFCKPNGRLLSRQPFDYRIAHRNDTIPLGVGDQA